MMNVDMPKLIIFDWEGTLSNSLGGVANNLNNAAKDLGLIEHDYAQLKPLLGHTIYALVQSLYPDISLEKAQKLIEKYQRYTIKNATQVCLFPGVLSLVKRLDKAGILLAVATCKGRQSLDIALEISGLKDYFFSTKTPNECLPKPHPEMLNELVTESGLDCGNAMMIGDSPSDMHAAVSAKILGVGFALDEEAEERLISAGAKHIVYNYKQLTALLFPIATN